MASVDQGGAQQQRRGSYREHSDGYVNEKGFGRSLSHGRHYSPQAQSAFYTPPRSFRQQAVGGDDFVVDKEAHAVRIKSRGGKFAAFLALSWFFTWPCQAPCRGSL